MLAASLDVSADFYLPGRGVGNVLSSSTGNASHRTPGQTEIPGCAGMCGLLACPWDDSTKSKPEVTQSKRPLFISCSGICKARRIPVEAHEVRGVQMKPSGPAGQSLYVHERKLESEYFHKTKRSRENANATDAKTHSNLEICVQTGSS